MEKVTEIINGFPVKNWCVMCEGYIKISWSNYQSRGNFCPQCNGKCAGKRGKDSLYFKAETLINKV